MNNALTPLVESVMVPLRETADAEILKKNLRI